MPFGARPTKYGGCEINAAAGIAGHDSLSGTSNWTITDGGLLGCFAPFITTWRTTSANEAISIPTIGAGYDFDIDWGDGTTGHFAGTAPSVTHTYAAAGDYQVKISGDFPRIYSNNGGDKLKILSVDQWGDVERTSMERAFMGCENLAILASDAPDLSNATNMEMMFQGATHLTGYFNHWDVSTITNMSYLFAAGNFNQPLS